MNKHRDSFKTTVYSNLPDSLVDFNSATVPNMSVSCRDLLRLYSQGARLPLMQGSQYDPMPHAYHFPADHLEALQCANDYMNNLSLPLDSSPADIPPSDTSVESSSDS